MVSRIEMPAVRKTRLIFCSLGLHSYVTPRNITRRVTEQTDKWGGIHLLLDLHADAASSGYFEPRGGQGAEPVADLPGWCWKWSCRVVSCPHCRNCFDDLTKADADELW